MNTNTSDTTTCNYNTEKMSKLCDNIIRALGVIKKNESIYQSNKEEMFKIIKFDNPEFYEKYPKICRILVYTDDISPLIKMIKTFGQVQEGTMSFDKANNIISSTINSLYIDPILNSDKLVKEREEKQKNMSN